jgi:D-alanyl-D-alanine carboxypeptidase/D-alanyl-D-alanine-endopeptidase (penicillin-binding protein 4)
MRPFIFWIYVTVSILPGFSREAEAQTAARTKTPGKTKAPAVEKRLAQALHDLSGDGQMKHAIYSLYVRDAETGKVLSDINCQTGLAPASNQKVIVSTAALEILGEDFQYQTRLAYDGSILSGVLKGNLYVVGSGDPTLGSWRYAGSREEDVMAALHAMLQKAGITRIDGDILVDDHRFSLQPVPGGWPWEDLGNYYGAGARGLNWHENQYDMDLEPGARPGDSTRVTGMRPGLVGDTLINGIKTGRPGSGDGSNIYLSPLSTLGYMDGTIAAGGRLTVGGSIPDPERQFALELLTRCSQQWNIPVHGTIASNVDFLKGSRPFPVFTTVLGSLPSPSLDSIVYWFLKKSINLYGEALVKTIALQRAQVGNTDTGVSIVRAFWEQRGIDPSAFHIMDGSGLSPQNRVTTFGLVHVLEYARAQPWFQAFYDGLPVIDGIVMKSGSIGGARAYSGYAGGKDGRKYTFSFIINNYDGSGTEIQHKMWKVLDLLK